jgi:hypothetical protein
VLSDLFVFEGILSSYGLTEYIFGMHKSTFVKDLVDEAGGAIVVAHPYRRVYRETAPQDKTSYAEMIRRGLRNEVFGYPLQKTLEMEKKISQARIISMHDKLLKSNTRVREGKLTEQESFHLLISELR